MDWKNSYNNEYLIFVKLPKKQLWQAPIFKRIGKPPMFRSYLRKKKRKTKESNTGAEDDVELVEFLARDY
jgi:hypothetical protein